MKKSKENPNKELSMLYIILNIFDYKNVHSQISLFYPFCIPVPVATICGLLVPGSKNRQHSNSKLVLINISKTFPSDK